jgi:uncharacterized repeat protein (TIGR01451 family)
MRFFDLRVVVVCLLVLCTIALSGNVALAQTVTTSPTSSAFGVPHGSTVSAEQLITITLTGGGTTTLTGFSTSANTDFAITSNTCPVAPGTLSSPGSCKVGITFTPSAPEGTLESGSLTFNASVSELGFTVPLTGALGAIKIFDELDVATSTPPGLYLSNPVTYGSRTVNLSCPSTGVTGVLSNAPANSEAFPGHLLEDNYLVLSISGTPVDNGGAPAGNVCPGPLFDQNGNLQQNDCFSSFYQNNAANLLGQNTDAITNANNIVGGPGGVPAINISSWLTFGMSTNGTPVSFTLLDGGGEVAGSTVFLQTNCTTPGTIQPGGSITGNPVNPNIPSSLTPQFAFSTTPGNNVVFTADYTGTAGSENTTAAPTVTDVGIRQSAFAAFVAGTSAAPAVCLRLNAEVDPSTHEVLCKGFLIQCTTASDSTASGSNCPQSAMDNLKFQAKFDSPDAPIPTAPSYSNFLPDGTNANGSACSNLATPPSAVCAHGTGPALLEGPDNWVSAATCSFPSGDLLNGSACPQNPLTAFRGAEDPGHTVTTKNTNSLFVPVVNMPLPTDTVAVTGQNGNGWVNTNSVPVKITANAAAYSPGTNNPVSNGFMPVGILTETYGTAPISSPVPDPDGGPVPGDTVKTNGACPTGAATAFVVNDTLPLSDGIYNLHHFPTDCANTEGLLFQPNLLQLQTASANWASFPITVIGVDHLAPTLTSCDAPPSPGPGGRYTSNVTIHCTVTDQGYSAGVSGSGFTPLLANSIQGSPNTVVALSTSVAAGTYNPAALTNSPNVCDLAGNCVIVPALGPFVVDLLGSADLDIAAGSLSPSTVKAGTTVTYAVIAKNYGPSTAQGVSITDILPSGATFSSGFILNGFSFANCTGSTTVTCPIGNLNKGGVVLAFITIKVPSASGNAVSNISIGSLNPDPKSADNTVTVTTKVK